MLFHSTLFWHTIVVLLSTAAYSVLLGGISKTKFFGHTKEIFGLTALGFLVGSLWSCYTMLQLPWGWIVTVLGCFWSGVFFIGAMVAVNKDFSSEKDGFHINKSSRLYRFLIDVCMFDPDKDRSLCALSWMAMGMLVCWPLILAFGAIAVIVVAAIQWLLGAKSPIKTVKEMMDYFQIPDMEWKKLGRVPLSPLMWAAIVAFGYLVVWLWQFEVARTLLISGGSGITAIMVGLFAEALSPRGRAKSGGGHYKPGVWDVVYVSALAPTGRAIKATTVTPVTLIIKTIGFLKGKFCPTIILD